MFKLILLILCLVLIPIQLMAVSNQDVRFTVHNMAYNPSNQSLGITDEDRQISANNANATEVCIFCHTPHNAVTSGQLWNKVTQGGLTYQMYTSSPRLSFSVKTGSNITAGGGESLLCLSCHDGKTAINVLHNSKTYDSQSGSDFVLNVGVVSGARTMDQIGSGYTYTDDIGATRDQYTKVVPGGTTVNLTDDHPIGFSYLAARGDAGMSSKLRPLDGADSAKSYGMRFFGPGGDRVECSTCHNPHVYYGQGKDAGSRTLLPQGATQAQLDRTPFLVRDNNGSAICLSCHIK